MGMTIDEAVEMLVNATYSDEWQGNEKLTKAQHMALDIMRKYQKIEDIYYHQSGEALENSLRAVIEDGKID